MLTLDTHAHIFPSVIEKVLPSKYRESVEEWVQNVQLPASFTSVKSFWIKWVETLQKKPLDIETVSWMQSRLHPDMYKAVESLMLHIIGPKQIILGTVHGLLDSMERHKIDKTVIIGARSYAPNDWILEKAREHPNLIPVIALPECADNDSEAIWTDEVERCVKAGAAGFKIHAHMDGITAKHTGVRSFFEVAKATGRFIILHTGCFHVPTYKRGDAHALEEFEMYFKDYPEVRVCLAHMNRDYPEQAWAMMKKYPQLYADTSWQPAANIRQALAIVGSDRLLLGSDWPLLHVELQGDALSLLRAACSDEQFEKICSNNAEIFLGL